MNYESLANLAGPHVVRLFEAQPHPELLYHDLRHTRHVADRVMEIAHAEGISDEDKVILEIAARFHDTGHLNGEPQGHEMRSVAYMREFMKEHGVADEEFISAVASAIMATIYPHQPITNLDRILEDADTYHLGTTDFKKTNKQVKKELKLRGQKEQTKDWKNRTLALLESHEFHTAYCKELLNEGKQDNINWMKDKIQGKKKNSKKKEKKKEEPEEQAEMDLSDITIAPEKKKQLAVKQKNSLVARGLQTMLRLASQNQVELSNLADGKANILISVNAIIISVILSVLIRRLEVDTYLTIPTMFFLASSVVTIVIAILATRPKLTGGTFSKEDIISRKTNLLFFGNFYKSTLHDYQWAMDQMMNDREYIYGSLIKDIYYLGVVLGRKYKLIRLAYNVFMIGIVVAVIAFTLAVLLKNPQDNITVTNGTVPPL